jgi:hypothetical protein
MIAHGFGARGRSGAAAHGKAARALGAVIRRSPAFVCRASGQILYRFNA